MLRIAISACLLGSRVRYDGGHKRDAALLEALDPLVEWVPVCPEVECGMGTPREPVRHVRTGSHDLRMIGLESGTDQTARMQSFARSRIEELARAGICGYVFKARSPSCGVTNVSVYDADGRVRETGRGLFVAAVQARLPGLPMEEEDRLADARLREAFLARARAYVISPP
jgi:uncharacterized protein YbbK (DUF523 family)